MSDPLEKPLVGEKKKKEKRTQILMSRMRKKASLQISTLVI